MFSACEINDVAWAGVSFLPVCALTSWGRNAGATRAYLQVREENEIARDLYRALGFADAYRYTHRGSP